MPLLVPQAPRDPLVNQAEATMGSQDFQDHLVHLDLLEDHTLESPGTHVVRWHHTHTQKCHHCKVWPELRPFCVIDSCQYSRTTRTSWSTGSTWTFLRSKTPPSVSLKLIYCVLTDYCWYLQNLSNEKDIKSVKIDQVFVDRWGCFIPLIPWRPMPEDIRRGLWFMFWTRQICTWGSGTEFAKST